MPPPQPLNRSLDRSDHLKRLLEFALVVRTLRERARLQILLDHVAAAALRTLLRNRLAPRHKIAIRIAIAAVERLPALRPPLDNFALAAIRALHANRLLLDE